MAGRGAPLRILMVSNYYPEHVGGIETVADNLARYYRRAGHTVRWCAALPEGQPHVGHQDDVPLPAWNATERHLGFPYPVPGLRSYRVLLRETRQCDVVHLHDCLYVASAFTGLLARLLRKPVLVTQHVGLVPYRSRLLRGLQRAAFFSLGRLVLSGAHRVVFVSPTVRDWFTSFIRFRRPPELIENGVDLDVFMPSDASTRRHLRTVLGLTLTAPVILFVGRFVEKKGIRLLRPAITATPSWFWVLIGRSDTDDPATWQLPNLRVLAPVSPSALRDYYATADLVALPSVGEGFPVVVQEAMACGTPAVVSEEVATVAESVRSLLFVSRQDPGAIMAAIADALSAFAQSPELRDRVAQFARVRWNWRVISQRYEQVLLELLGRVREPAKEVA